MKGWGFCSSRTLTFDLVVPVTFPAILVEEPNTMGFFWAVIVITAFGVGFGADDAAATIPSSKETVRTARSDVGRALRIPMCEYPGKGRVDPIWTIRPSRLHKISMRIPHICG